MAALPTVNISSSDLEGATATPVLPTVNISSTDLANQTGKIIPGADESPSGFKGLLDGVFQDFAKPVVTLGAALDRAGGVALENASNATEGMTRSNAVSNLFQHGSNFLNATADRVVNQGAEDPFGGTIKPFSGAEDAAAGGLKLVSYGFTNPVAFGALQGAGKTLEDKSQGKDWTTSLEEGGTTGLTSAGALLALGIGGKVLAWGGGQILSDPAAKVLMTSASDFMKGIARRVPGVLDKGAQSVSDLLGNIGSTAYNALSKDFQEGMDNMTGKLGTMLQKPVADATDVLNGLQQQARASLEAAYKPISDAFSNLYKAPSNISELPRVNTALQAGEDYLSSIANKNAVGATALKNPDMLNALGREQAPNLASYLDTVKGYLGDNPNLTLGQVIHLAQVAPPGTTSAESQAIGDISQNLFRDARDYLSKNNPDMLGQWDDFSKQWQDVKQNHDTNFADQFKTAAKVSNFVQNLFSGGKKATTEQLQNLMSGFSEGDKQHLSQLIFNDVLQQSTQGVDREAGAKMIDNVVNKYGELLDPRHTVMLQQMSDFMKGNLESTLTNLQQTSGLGEEGATAAEKLASQAKDLKNIDATGIMQKVANGNTQEALDSILKVKNPEQMKSLMGLFSEEQKAQLRSSVISNALEDTSLLGESTSETLNPEGLQKQLTAILNMDSKTGHELFDQDTINELVKAKKGLDDLETLGQADVKGRLKATAIALLHASYGHAAFAASSGVKALTPTAENKAASAIVNEMIDNGSLKAGFLRTILSKTLRGTGKAIIKSAPAVVNAGVSAVNN